MGDTVQLHLSTEGRPLNANIELWQGPDNTPQIMDIYVEDGALRPFNAVLGTPRSGPNAIAIRNTANIEFPLSARVEGNVEKEIASSNNDGYSMGYSSAPVGSIGLSELTRRLSQVGYPKVIQGGAITTIPFPPKVGSVQILIRTDGRPLNARIEMLQGPNNNKVVMDIYSEDGMERPFYAVIETPGVGNVVRVVNTATVEFPLTAIVEPFSIDPTNGSSYYNGDASDTKPIIGGVW